MQLLDQIEKNLTQALKDKNAELLSVLRLIKTALKNAEIAKRPEPLSSDDEIRVLRSEVKKREDAGVTYRQGGREDLANKEAAEIEVIKKYLPADLSDAEITQAVGAAVAESQATSVKDFGKVMGLAMKKLAGRADGAKVGIKVREQLSK